MNTAATHATNAMQDKIMDDAYEHAEAEGFILWMPATLVDPGCYDVDLELAEYEVLDTGDWGEPLKVRAVVKAGTALVFDRTYEVCGPDTDSYDN